MNKYRFYVITKKTIKYTSTLKQATKLFQTIDYVEGYKALGVEKNSLYGCDLLIENNGILKISNDYKIMEEFRNDIQVSNFVKEIEKEIF